MQSQDTPGRRSRFFPQLPPRRHASAAHPRGRLDRLLSDEPCFSFEFFPPHTEKGVESLFRTVVELAPLNPGYVSCTYPGSATPAGSKARQAC